MPQYPCFVQYSRLLVIQTQRDLKILFELSDVPINMTQSNIPTSVGMFIVSQSLSSVIDSSARLPVKFLDMSDHTGVYYYTTCTLVFNKGTKCVVSHDS